MLKTIKDSAKNLRNVRGMVLTAMMIAICAVLGIWKFNIGQMNRITVTFAALAVSGMVLGPVPAILVGFFGDFFGFLLVSGGGGYSLHIGISAAIKGIIYGIFLYKMKEDMYMPDKECPKFLGKKINNLYEKNGFQKQNTRVALVKIIKAEIVTMLFVNIILNSIWSCVLKGVAVAYAEFIPRVIKNIILCPIQVIVVFTLYKLIRSAGIQKKYK